MSKEQTPITADQQTIKDLWNAKTADEIAIILKKHTNAKVLEVLGEVDKYCDGKISHFSKAPMDLQGIHATREVKTYLNILRNRSKTKI